MPSSSIPEIISAVSHGQMVIVFDDDKNREFEGDIIISAAKITPEIISFMAHTCGGLICVAVDGMILDHLKIPLMVLDTADKLKTNWTISVDHKNAGTGISATNRALTIRELANPNSQPDDFIKPGHMFPLRAHPNGLSARRGHTESAIELMKLAGEIQAAAMCEIMLPNGEMLRADGLEKFSEHYQIPYCTISEIANYIQNIPAKF